MRLYDLARVIRSKNAGPFTLTIDIVFETRDDLARALASAALSPQCIAQLYRVEAPAVRVMPFERVLTIKVSMPRPGASSGAPGDTDVYGCSQHFPLADCRV